MIYVDHNATTRPLEEVVVAMREALVTHWANASSVHGPGQRARECVEAAREHVARAVGVPDARTVMFTSSGTEAAYSAVLGVAVEPALSRVVTTAVEHPCVKAATDRLAALGCEIDVVPVDSRGRLALERLEEHLGAAGRRRPTLVTMQWANHETGNLNPVTQVSRMCRAVGVPLHIDAVQALGKVPVDAGVADLVSLSAHKIHGPKGVGALVVRQSVRWHPLMPGGQERGQRGGTENVAAIVGFGVASRFAVEELAPRSARLRELCARLEHGLRQIEGCVVNGDPEQRVPGTVNVSFERVSAELLVIALDIEGVAVSAGAACSSGLGGVSPVLLAMFPDDHSRVAGGVRFSLGKENTDEEVGRIVAITEATVARLRSTGSTLLPDR